MSISSSLSHAASVPGSVAAHKARITSIDALRGFVMVVMMLDHVREHLYLHLNVTDPMTVPGTPADLYFSRLAAHFCAPVFVFLTGLSAWLYANPPSGASRDVRSFLLKRGLLVIALELTVVNLAWNGTYNVLYLQVMWAIGFSMVALALLSGLPRWLLAALGLVIVCGHNAVAGYSVAADSPWYPLWTLMLHRGWLVADGVLKVKLSYPALPWVGVILLGYSFAPLFSAAVDKLRRQQVLVLGGLACWLLLLLLRGFNIYGENAPWAPGATALETVMHWLNFTKYPPSLDFLLMTLGGGLLMLAALEFRDNTFTRVCATFGGAPMFYYILHLYVLMFGYRIALAIFGPNQGTRFGVDVDSFWIVWVVWLAVVALVYYPVKVFGDFKRRTSIGWVKYF
ncbi:MAG TPA: heparan-alpha-glucosaminide N-acetyltransferase domain-containing protein [Roseateles sp.]